VHDVVLSSGWDTALYAVPVILMLVAGVFRLDELVAAPREASRRHRGPTGVDENGEPMLSDPDGRPFCTVRSHKRGRDSR
jgi:hypothetical protein